MRPGCYILKGSGACLCISLIVTIELNDKHREILPKYFYKQKFKENIYDLLLSAGLLPLGHQAYNCQRQIAKAQFFLPPGPVQVLLKYTSEVTPHNFVRIVSCPLSSRTPQQYCD